MSGTLTTGTLILTASQYNGDGFGRIRVSNPSTLFEVNFLYDKQPQKIQEVTTGSGTSTFVGNLSYISMSTTGASGSVVRQSKEYIPYQPGKSKLVFLSGILAETNPLPANITTRIGHYDSYEQKTLETNPIGNGHFFEMVGGATPVVNVVERSFYNPSIITIPPGGWGYENRVAQANWNIDTLNGTGGTNNPSGLNINFYLENVFVIDLQWLGVGQVRMGVFYNNQIYYCHKFNVSNRNHTYIYNGSTYDLQNTPYSQYAKLPVRYEIISTGTNTGSMRQVCSTALSEGGYIPYGISGGFTNNTAITLAGTDTLIFAIRLNSNNIRATLKLQIFNILVTGTNDIIQYKILLNPTLGGTALVYSNIDNTNFPYGQYAYNAGSTTYTGGSGYLIQSGFLTNSINNQANITLENLSLLPTINASIEGSSDILVLVARYVTGSGVTMYSSATILAIL